MKLKMAFKTAEDNSKTRQNSAISSAPIFLGFSDASYTERSEKYHKRSAITLPLATYQAVFQSILSATTFHKLLLSVYLEFPFCQLYSNSTITLFLFCQHFFV